VRKKLLTQSVLAQIPRWREGGLDAADIAKKIGCTVGTLRVCCSRYGISLRDRSARRESTNNDYGYGEITRRAPEKLILTLPDEIRARLQARAALLGMSESAFLIALIETVDRDDLYSAVLDDGG